MKSFYFETRKDGATRFLKKKMLETVIDGDMRKIRSYNRHGREQSTIVQITCDASVGRDFLTMMRREGIKRLPVDYDPMRLTDDHPVSG